MRRASLGYGSRSSAASIATASAFSFCHGRAELGITLSRNFLDAVATFGRMQESGRYPGKANATT
jgi:hypothetical protein